MRLISQNGEYDIPYENCLLTIKQTDKNAVRIIASSNLENFSCFTLAKYKDIETADKAMKKMWEKYLEIRSGGLTSIVPPRIYQFPSEEEVLNG